MKKLKEIMLVGLLVAGVTAGVVLLIFGSYLFVRLLSFVFSDPYDWVKTPPVEKYTKWDRCVNDTRKIWDNINDTMGATYALEDTPSLNAREFVQYCLENNPEGD